jgi:hypothetical protein
MRRCLFWTWDPIRIEIPATSTMKQTVILIANSAKLDETMAKKQNNLLSLRGWTSGEISQRWWLVVMIGDKNDNDSMSVTNVNQNPGKTDHSVASQNSYWRLNAQNIDILGYRLFYLRPRGQIGKYGQIVWSPFPYLMTSHEGGWEGCHRKGGGGGFSGLNAKPETDCQPYLPVPNHSIYQSGFPNNYFGLDPMNNPRKSVSGNTLITSRTITQKEFSLIYN